LTPQAIEYFVMNIEPASISRDFVFVSGRIISPMKHGFIAHHKESLNEEIYRTHVFILEGGHWEELAVFKWQSVDLAVMTGKPLEIVVLGRDGQIGVVGEQGSREERVDPKKTVGPMRGLSETSESLLAHGMKREVFRRTINEGWEHFDRGMHLAFPTGKVDIKQLIKDRIKDMGGINSITEDGGHLYAFGMRGEIWRFEGEFWRKVDSPTNVMLTDSSRSVGGNICVCGHAGVILMGNADAWRVLEYTGAGKLDFAAIATFRDAVYIADGHSLRILKEDSMRVVDFGLEEIAPSSVLHSTEKQLLSVAGMEIFTTNDGEIWASLLPTV
jgi:hypothetical protein